MARIAIAGFAHESNTFSPMPTPFEEFAATLGDNRGLLRGDAIFRAFRGKRINVTSCGFISAAEKRGHELVPLLHCTAEPAGQVTLNAFERVMAIIVSDLVDQGPFDAVFVELHGAMAYEGFHHGEEEILRRVRAIVGDIPIVAPLDLHGNITPGDMELATALVGYRTYPHTDMFIIGERCATVLDYLLSGRPLFKAFRMLPFLIPPHRQSTNTEPARSAYALIAEVEKRPGVVSASIMMGFPPADVEFAGPSAWAYGTTQQSADDAVDRLYQNLLVHEADFVPSTLSTEDAVTRAIELAKTASKPVILADVQDNPGGGATSDTVWILESLVRHGAQGAALGLLHDPDAALAAHKAGVGVDVTLDLGGKLMPGQRPFHGAFRVDALSEGPFLATGPVWNGAEVDLGKMALLRIGGVRVVVTTARCQALDQAYFRRVGIEPSQMKILVLKSTNHYRADFEPISSAILPVAAPAAMIEDASQATYLHLRDGMRLRPLGPAHKGAARG